MDDFRSEISEEEEEDDGPASSLQLRLAAMVVGSVIEQNGGRRRAAGFWDDDLFDSIDSRDEYLDPEFWDPDEETVPEMDEINWNIYECN